MKPLRRFTIPFHGLKSGLHHYDFEVDSAFFENFETSEIEAGEGNVSVALDKKPILMELTFKLDGVIEIPCDRCGESMKQTVSDKRTLFFKFGEERAEQSDEVIVLRNDEHELDVSHFIYEFFHLALPLKRTHEEGKCNEKAIHFLKEQDENEDDQKEHIDPRWEKLRSLQHKSDHT